MSVLLYIGAGINYFPESTSYARSYFRCLLDWAHYRSQPTVSALTFGPRRPEARSRWGSLLDGGRCRAIPRAEFVRRFLASQLRRWISLAAAVRNTLNPPDHSAEIAEESARYCLAGLSRISVGDDAKGPFMPLADSDILAMLESKPKPRLLTAGNLK